MEYENKWKELKTYMEHLIDPPSDIFDPQYFLQLMGDKIKFSPELVLDLMKQIEEEVKD